MTAINSVGPGQESAPSNATTPTTSPGAPTGVSATAGVEQATVNWTPPANDGGSPISSYRITPYIGANAQTPTTVSAPASSKTITGLTGGTTYTFTVTAINSVGPGQESAPSNATTPTTSPGAPTGVSATAGVEQATVNWTPPANDGGSPISSYRITPYIGANAQTPTTVSAPASSKTITGLTGGTTYTFTVTAINSVGPGQESAASNATTPTTSPGAPTGVSATAGVEQATVNWTPPANDGGSPISSYRITPYIGANAQTPTTVSAPASSKTITGLTGGTTYTFTVTAINSVGPGQESAASNATTPTTSPGAPTGVSATAGVEQATVNWTPPANDGGSPISSYRITPYIGSNAQTPTTVSAPASSKTITGLTGGTTYTFTVTAINSVGPGQESAPSASVTPYGVPLHATSTSVSCTPASLLHTSSTTCTATVLDNELDGFSYPSGTIQMTSNTPGGQFSGEAECTLTPTSTVGASKCALAYTPEVVESGSHRITAEYLGDSGHAASAGSTVVTIPERTTTLTFTCDPNPILKSEQTECMATVVDDFGGLASPPTGSVQFTSSVAAGRFSNSGKCTLLQVSGSTSKCQVSYFPTENVGMPRHSLTARYSGDSVHLSSGAVAELDVPATPPHGPLGVSIDGGAWATNNSRVLLMIRWPARATTALISNDEGFDHPGSRVVSRSIHWTLPSSGPERIPRAVYVRFVGGPAGPETYTDDIILDKTAPRIASAWVMRVQSRRKVGQPKSASRKKSYALHLDAYDNASGLKEIEISTNRRHVAHVFRVARKNHLRKTFAVSAGVRRLFVRAKDSAGNVSRWRAARFHRPRHHARGAPS